MPESKLASLPEDCIFGGLLLIPVLLILQEGTTFEHDQSATERPKFGLRCDLNHNDTPPILKEFQDHRQLTFHLPESWDN